MNLGTLSAFIDVLVGFCLALLHKLRDLSHLLRPMNLALAPKQSDYTGLHCRTVGGQWNLQRFQLEFELLGL